MWRFYFQIDRVELMEGDFSSFVRLYFDKRPCKIIFKC